MTTRFNYSRWDGTQRGFEFDAQSIVDEITDDLLYHGDVNAAPAPIDARRYAQRTW
ncbi:hypothetical protein EMGBS4_20030 [Acidimicrobiaceae bacterium]|nr:hypothetical protein EMGBS4_20030 [Acidimicrobiaceae bacterium]